MHLQACSFRVCNNPCLTSMKTHFLFCGFVKPFGEATATVCGVRIGTPCQGIFLGSNEAKGKF